MAFCTIVGQPDGNMEDFLRPKESRYLQLFDCYGALLTERQREICEQYFLYDLSLTEIAEEKGVSKQSVSDTLATSRNLLDEYEEKLHVLCERTEYSRAVSDMMTNVTRALADFAEKYPEHAEEAERIAKLVVVGELVEK